MKRKKHYTIPFFIPHKGCPYQCIFCDQEKITGDDGVSPDDIPGKIEEYLKTMPPEGSVIEAGFFGGTFTGMDIARQEEFLAPVQGYIKEGKIAGIRLSTRPDFIDKEILSILKKYNVTCIELGVQSMSAEVLNISARGYLPSDVERASSDILSEGFDLAHQMMVGLPGSSPEDEYLTVKKAMELGAGQIRIYPVLVMEGTVLSEMWKKGEYSTLSEEEAVERCLKLIVYCGVHNISVLRCGLHPSEGLTDGSEYLSGPFHPAFRQKVESRIFSHMLAYISENMQNDIEEVRFNPADEACFFGFNGENSRIVKKISGDNRKILHSDGNVPKGTIKVCSSGGEYEINTGTIYKNILPGILL